MRHKILDCITEFMGIGDVEGVVEMDETFIPLSYKGNIKIIWLGINGLKVLMIIKK